MRNLNLKVKLAIMVSLVAVLGFGSTIGLITYIQEQNAKQKAFEITKLTAQQVGNKVKGELEISLDASRTLANAFKGIKIKNLADRNIVNAQLRQVLEDNNNFFGVWTCWEPNAFDNKDSEFLTKLATDGYDKTGRLIPYWSRPDNKISLEPLADYETPVAGDYYLIAKKTGEEVILEPYEYPVAGKKVLMTSVVVPIKIDNKFVGVSGIDIDLDRINKTVNSIKLDYGEASLLSPMGLFTSHKDSKNLLKKLSDVNPQLKDLTTTVASGKTYEYLDKANNLYYVAVPVQIGNTKTYWATLITMPLNQVLGDLEHTHSIAMITSVVSIILLTGLMMFLLQIMVNNPLKRLEKAMTQVSQTGRFKNQLAVSSNDEIGRIFIAFNALTQTIDSAITAIKEVTQGLSHGNLKTRILGHFNGDLDDLKQNINASMSNLSATLSKVINNTQQVAVSSNQTSFAINQVAEGSSEQLGTIDSIVHFIDNNLNLLSEVKNGLNTAGVNAQSSSESSQKGSQQMQKMVAIAELIVENSTKINRITNVIGEIAEKTNLLALNAAIESARAGETGRGFAIVADEVRKLAENSASQVSEITNLVSEAVKQANESLDLANNVHAEIGNINSHVASNREIFNNIRQKIEQQLSSMNELNQQANSLRSIAESNSSNAQEVTATVEHLSDVAKDTKVFVEQFKI